MGGGNVLNTGRRSFSVRVGQRGLNIRVGRRELGEGGVGRGGVGQGPLDPPRLVLRTFPRLPDPPYFFQ